MIIGFTGYKHVGKSTAAKLLEERGFTRLNFKGGLITHLKERFPDVLRELSIIYDMSVEELFENKPPAMRALMVNVGTDDRRRDKQSYWTDIWEVAYAKLHPVDVVVDDCRFISEAETIRKYGGKIIRLVRPDITDGGTHESETQMNSIIPDYTIELEPGSHDKLEFQLIKILEKLQ